MTTPTLFDIPDYITTHPPTVALARRTDPETSHVAAASLSAVRLTTAQRAVLVALHEFGPLCDHELVDIYKRVRVEYGFPEQTDSSIRSRRSDLTKKLGLVVLDGHGRAPSGKPANRWRVLGGVR